MMDIIAAAVLLLSTISGARRGFVSAMVSFMQWFVCIIAGFLFCGKAADFLSARTGIDDWIYASVMKHVQTTMEDSTPYLALPDLFNGWIRAGTEELSESTASSVTEVMMTIIAFLGLVFGIKLLGWILVHSLSRRYNEGIIGFLDGFMGFVFGIGRGVILVLLLFALLVPVLALLMPDLSPAILRAVDDSYIASILYDDNVLLVLLRDLFS